MELIALRVQREPVSGVYDRVRAADVSRSRNPRVDAVSVPHAVCTAAT